jgi:hypothetical protein
MTLKLSMSAGLIAAALVFAGHAASAAPISSAPKVLGQVTTQEAGVQKVQWRRCRFWRRECAFRWGWGGWRFRRCMIRHGC